MYSYLQNRNGNYRFRIRVPSDLVPLLSSIELVKSLKTRDRKTANICTLPYLKAATQTFTLLRSGYLSPEQARGSLSTLLGKQQGILPPSIKAAQIISQEVNVNRH